MTSLAALAVLAAAVTLPKQLTLDDAVALARQHQPSLRQAKAGAVAATAHARQSLAPILPQVSLGLRYSRATSNVAPNPATVAVGAEASTISLSSTDFVSGNLTASGTLWDFGRNWHRYQASQRTADAQARAVDTAEAAALLQVRTAFFAAAAQHELVQVAQATLANTEAHLKQVDGFVKVGSRPEIDLAQSRAERANARLALLNATNAYAVARARLNQAMGVEASTDYDVVDAAPAAVEGEDAALEALLPEALKARPELEGLEAQLEAQRLTVRSTRAEYWPTVGAQVGATVAARRLDALVPNLSAQVSLSWALYEGGATMAGVSAGEAQLAQLEAQRDALAASVRLDVEQALLDVGAAKEAVGVAAEAAEAARERLRLAEGRYQAGAGNAIELGDAQVGFTNAAAQRVQAVFALASARARLVAALGRRG